ncbi:site-specific DNA-methyltransferase [Streptococcus devriesei]|uniref:site-specific DNA-methyltransferase n=1 Tax=Streptococcus devriesei TaxID=231233 RepID=UPI000400AC53|nr:site-specific DNA-methyltransferase [Streptococcus devriesei]
MSQNFIERPHKNEKEGAIAYVQELLKQAREDRRNDDVEKLENLIRLLNTKKYGLVWEEHAELVEEEMKTRIPVFIEDETKKIVGNPESEDFNFLLEGDNLHSLHLLKKTHAGAIDVIYIDPPYNTGAKNWKYNNNYIDFKDSYKHSKWISMMKSRLDCARLLLKEDGVLVCAIDENEVATLKLLLEEVFGNEFIVDIVTIIQNPRGIQGNNFSYTNEFALFVYKKNYKVIFEREVEEADIDWSPLRNWGSESLRTDAKNCFYGIKIKDEKIIGFEEVLDDNEHPTKNRFLEDGTIVVYPIDNSGIERKWRYARQTVETIWDILRPTFNKNIWDIEIGKPYTPYKTVWFDKKYDANEYGTQIINSMVPHNDFDFPKSLWNVYECLYATIKKKENAIVLDFFAGSGTTGHAVEMLNKLCGGNRKYILATNNAIGEKKEREFKKKFGHPEDYTSEYSEYEEKYGICSSITYPRLKAVSEGYTHKKDFKEVLFEKKLTQRILKKFDSLQMEVDKIVELNKGNYDAVNIVFEDSNVKVIGVNKKGNHIEGIPHNLKYFKTDFVVKEEFPDVTLEYELLNYVTPLVELEFGVDISNPKVQVILSEEQLDNMKESDFIDNSTLFIHPEVFFDSKQERILREKNITKQEIPDYYFGKDIWS